MIRIAICDDDKRIVAEIEERLEKISKEILLEVSIDGFYCGEGLEKIYRQGERYDIIYLDIEMAILDGIKVARIIREIDKYVIIIYISSHEEYLIQLFEVEPFRFIKKPIDYKIFDKYFEDAYKKIDSVAAYFEYEFKRNSVKILYSEIVYFESNGRSIIIMQKDSNVDKFNGKLNMIEKAVEKSNNPFLRIHQSYLVNFHYIRKICFSKVELFDGRTLNISEDKQKIIRERYSEILKGF